MASQEKFPTDGEPAVEARKPVVFFLSSSVPAAIIDLKKQFEKDPSARVIEVASARECVASIREAGRGVLIFSLTKKEEVAEIFTSLTEMKENIQDKLVRALGYNQVVPERIDPVLMQKGVTELLARSVTAKALALKVDRCVKVVETTWSARSGARLANNAQRTERSGSARETRDSAQEIVWVDPLKIEADFWLTTQKTGARKVMGRWTIEILGPAPSQGRWESRAMPAAEGMPREPAWEWKPSADESPFSPKGGQWVYFGRQPEFNLRTLRWQFGGESPALDFYIEGQPIARRFGCDENRVFSIARNSENGKKLTDAILDSLAMQVKFMGGAAKNGEEMMVQLDPNRVSKELSVELDDAASKPWNENIGEDGVPIEWNLDAKTIGMSVALIFSGDIREPAKFMDLIETQMILETGSTAATVGRDLRVFIQTENVRPTLEFDWGAKVELIEELDGAKVVTVALTDFRREHLRQFGDVFLSRQDSIVSFLKAVKGA